LFSLQIGNGTNKSGDWNAINWKNARVTTAVSLNGTQLATLEMPLTAVPYALYADSVDLNVIAHFLETYQIPTEAEQNVQSDWAETDATSDTYIQHKPNISDSIDTKLENYTTTAEIQATYATKEKVKADSSVVFDTLHTYYATKAKVKADSNVVFDTLHTYYATKAKVKADSNVVFDTLHTYYATKAKVKADSNVVFDTLHTYYATKANVSDGLNGIRSDITNAKYVSNKSCDSLDFCGLIAVVNNLATDMRGFQHDVNNLKDSINDLNAKIDALENTIRILAGYQKVLDLSTVTSDTTIYNGQTVTGTLNGRHKISILHGAIVTLNGVNIGDGDSGTENSAAGAGLTCLGDATIILKDGTTNIVRGLNQNYPGVFVPVGSTLTIQGETQGNGKLIASSNGYGAGIGGGHSISCGNIIIKSGTIEATGGENAAGIGGGKGTEQSHPDTCGNITIIGGTVTAIGGENAAGIGSGQGPAFCGKITISGGEVKATGGDFAAGIGSGYGATCGIITISGGTVTATGGTGTISASSSAYAGGAGIGSGVGADNGGSCTDITISGGDVTATGGTGAAGIGGGSGSAAAYPSSCGKITIQNTVNHVKATKGTNATNSIGAGIYCSCKTVTIGGTVYWDETTSGSGTYEYKNGGNTYLTPDTLIYPPQPQP
jgi:hypothetical protein